MSIKIMTTELPNIFEISPLAKCIRNGTRWLVRHVSPAASSAERTLAVEERVSIGSKKMLILIRCCDRRFLVATAGDSVGPFIEVAPRKNARRSRKDREA